MADLHQSTLLRRIIHLGGIRTRPPHADGPSCVVNGGMWWPRSRMPRNVAGWRALAEPVAILPPSEAPGSDEHSSGRSRASSPLEPPAAASSRKPNPCQLDGASGGGTGAPLTRNWRSDCKGGVVRSTHRHLDDLTGSAGADGHRRRAQRLGLAEEGPFPYKAAALRPRHATPRREIAKRAGCWLRSKGTGPLL